jgi:hypothetical protein
MHNTRRDIPAGICGRTQSTAGSLQTLLGTPAQVQHQSQQAEPSVLQSTAPAAAPRDVRPLQASVDARVPGGEQAVKGTAAVDERHTKGLGAGSLQVAPDRVPRVVRRVRSAAQSDLSLGTAGHSHGRSPSRLSRLTECRIQHRAVCLRV